MHSLRRLRRNLTAAAGAAVLSGLSACGTGPVQVDVPRLSSGQQQVCAALVNALPAAVSDQRRRRTDPAGAPAAAWGDPAIVLRCGVPMPDGFDKFASCQQVNGVGWFVPRSAFDDQDADVVMTTIGRRVNVEVMLPGTYRPPAAAMVDLAEAIKRTDPDQRPCV